MSMDRARRGRWNRTLAAGLLALWGCAVRVQHGLDERQANEMQAVLVERGFEARKVEEDGRRPTWAIEVAPEQAADAVRVLAELGLPRPRNEGFRDVFKPGLVPDPVEQHVRFLEAAAGELAQTLEAVDGVASARVHLVVPAPPRSGQPGAPSKASAFVRVRPGALERILAMREELRSLVAGGVEGLTPDAVALVVTEVVSSVPTPLGRGATASRALLLVGALGALVIALGVAVSLLALRLGTLSRRRVVAPVPSTPPAQRPTVAIARAEP
jgi:type III secretion protein J